MKTLIILFAMWLSAAVHAETVMVRSGEHDGFTRLVFSWPKKKEWTLTRNHEGYSLVIAGAPIQYDISAAFKRITNQRVAEMTAQSNTLHLVLACRCSATPIALGDNMLVVDIKNDTYLDGNVDTRDLARKQSDPIIKGAGNVLRVNTPAKSIDENQLQVEIIGAIAEAAKHTPNQLLGNILETRPSLEHVRTELLMQLSRGAATGVVETVDQIPKPSVAAEELSPPENIRIQREMGISAGTARSDNGEMTATGNSCIPDDQLNIGDWADPSNVISEYADNTTGLVGEFDHPDSDAISRAVRYYLSIGFGAEARQIMAAFKYSDPEGAVLETLSYIIDLDLPPGTELLGMENCDNSASIWAVLANKDLDNPTHISAPAVIRTFSALPIHLRRLLGPGLAERFLAVQDYATALAIRDAVLRTAQQSDPLQKMLEARLELAAGNIESAESQLSELAGASGPAGIEATIALIRAQVDDGREVAPDLTTTAEALLHEVKGSENEIEMRKALALAYASQNRFVDAFAQVDKNTSAANQVWDILANHGSDDAMFTTAFLQFEQEIPPISAMSREKIGRHLLDLGFPNQALLWLGPSIDQDDVSLVLSAEAQLSLNNHLEVLSLLEGKKNLNGAKLKARALAGLQASDAVDQLMRSDQENEASVVAKNKRDWPNLLKIEKSELWQRAAALVGTAPNGIAAASEEQPQQEKNPKGPLASSRDTLTESVSARDIITKLLTSKSMPDLPKR